MDGYIRPRIEERGIVLEIEDRILFDSGRAEIREDARQLLAKVSGILKSVPNQIIVEGHTDNVPIKTARYPSNWELSVDRAVHVVRYFIETQHIAPERFIATGYGEYQPVAPNDTAAGRARNRRVNIVIYKLLTGGDELGSTGEESNDGKRSSSWPKILAVSAVLLAALVLTVATIWAVVIPSYLSACPGAREDGYYELFGPEGFTVNLNDSSQRRYLKAGVVLAYREKKLLAELEQRQAQLRDLTITVLRRWRAHDLAQEDGLAALRTELLTAVNEVLTRGEVKEIFFTEFLVQ